MQRTHDEAYPGPWRMRVTHLVADDRRDVALIYDLERTFVIEVPKRLLPCIGQWPPDRSTDPNLRAWLLHKGLLTTAESPDWSDRAGVEAPKITDISLDLSGACNMGCRYCFEKMTQSRIGRMGEGTLTAALDLVFTEAAGFDHIALHFGSGEPLIEIELLKRLVREAEARAAASGQRLTFELTTNATLVTPAIVTFLAEHPFNLRVSCDGPAEIHDRNRPRANGRASYSFVKRGLDLLLEHMPEQVTVNTVLCGNTPLRTIWAWAKDTGLRHFHVIKVGADLNAPETLPASELEEFRADLSGICDDMFADLTAGRRPIDFQPITKIIRRLMIPAPITRFCGVAGSYVGVASDGRLYPCLRHLGLKEYALGSVFDGIDDGARVDYRSREAAYVDSRPGCRACWARYLCGGGCYADSVVYGQDKLHPKVEHCSYWRAEIAQAIRFYHRLRVSDPLYALVLFGDDLSQMLDGLEPRPPAFTQSPKTF